MENRSLGFKDFFSLQRINKIYRFIPIIDMVKGVINLSIESSSEIAPEAPFSLSMFSSLKRPLSVVAAMIIYNLLVCVCVCVCVSAKTTLSYKLDNE